METIRWLLRTSDYRHGMSKTVGVHLETQSASRLVSILVRRANSSGTGIFTMGDYACNALLPPHPANRHNTGCRGAGADRVGGERVSGWALPYPLGWQGEVPASHITDRYYARRPWPWVDCLACERSQKSTAG